MPLQTTPLSGAPLALADVVLRQRSARRSDDRSPVFDIRDVRIDSRRFSRALAADLAVVPTDQRRAEVTVWIGRRFSRFTAIVGRDDTGASSGPGLAAFEVYGDGRLLWKSDGAIGTARVRVKSGSGARIRTGGQPVDVSIDGVTRLRLVARYATEINQEAPGIMRASGCAFADARLYPTAATSETVPPTSAGIMAALLRLAAATVRQLSTIKDAPRVPVRLVVAPFPEGSPGTARLPRDLPLDPFRSRTLAETASHARLGAEPVFRPLDGRATGRFERMIRGNKGAADNPERWSAAAVAAAQEVGADTVLVPLLRPPMGGNGWSVELRLFVLTRTGEKNTNATSILNPVETAIVLLGRNS